MMTAFRISFLVSYPFKENRSMPLLWSSKLLHSKKKCWVKCNPALGEIWTNPATGLF